MFYNVFFFYYIRKIFFFYFFRKDGLKELIVEMRIEDERIINYEDGSLVNESNEIILLTEFEYVVLSVYL